MHGLKIINVKKCHHKPNMISNERTRTSCLAELTHQSNLNVACKNTQTNEANSDCILTDLIESRALEISFTRFPCKTLYTLKPLP